MIQIFFSTNDKMFAKGINFFSRLKTGDSWCSHTGVIINGKSTIEALPFGLRSRDFLNQVRGIDKVEVYDLITVDKDEMSKVEVELWQQLGKFRSLYGWVKIPFQLADSIISFIKKEPTFIFSKVFSAKWFPICSEFVGWVLYKLDLSDDWRGKSPDDLYDQVKRSPNKFSKNYSLSTV